MSSEGVIRIDRDDRADCVNDLLRFNDHLATQLGFRVERHKAQRVELGAHCDNLVFTRDSARGGNLVRVVWAMSRRL